METEGDESGEVENLMSDDNLGSCGSVEDAKTPEDDTESLSLSSPGCLSGLSSLQSPAASLASPLTLMASPCPAEQQQQQQQQQVRCSSTRATSPRPDDPSAAVRSPVGANPRDANNPLSVNQLTKRDFAGATKYAAAYAPYSTYSGAAAIAAPQFAGSNHRDATDDGAISVT